MERRRIGIVVGCALLLAVAPGIHSAAGAGGANEGTDEPSVRSSLPTEQESFDDWVAMRSAEEDIRPEEFEEGAALPVVDLDLDRLPVQGFDIELPSQGSDIELSSAFGNDAGCDPGVNEWEQAQSGTPTAPCEAEIFNWGIEYTVIRCIDPPGCQADALQWDEERNLLAWLWIPCQPESLLLVDWSAETAFTLAGECEVVQDGDPTTFDNWDSWGTTGLWSHTDNLADAVYHLAG